MGTRPRDQEEEVRISGVPIVSGIGVGKAMFLGTSPQQIRELTLPQEEIEHEIHRYYKALQRSKLDIVELEREAKGKQGQQEIASILQAHLEIIKDPILTEEVVNTIRKDRKNAEYVFSSIMGKIEESLFLAQGCSIVDRIQDIHDISKRVIGHLCQQKHALGNVDQNIIVFSESLTPSEVAGANPSYIRGFVSLMGSSTSHTAIVSRAKNIPYLTNVSQEMWNLIREYEGRLVLIDSIRGELVFNPSLVTLKASRQKQRYPVVMKQTTSLQKIEVSSHAGSVNDLEILKEFFPCTSVGLFRSEFLAIASGRLPSFIEQAMVYKKLAQLSEKGAVLRLFDFGADKPCPGIPPCEERSVRWLLKHPNVLDVQLEAILSAVVFGKIKILVPGISDVTEFIAIKKRFENICASYHDPVCTENFSWGAMIEFPSAVWMVDEILQHCEFISIGTNDLAQYTLGNSRESILPEYLYPIHPSLVRMIHHVLHNAKQKGIPVSICGEVAANEKLAPLFLGLGVHELSVSIPSILELRQCLSSLDLPVCKKVAAKILKAKSCQEVQNLLALLTPF